MWGRKGDVGRLRHIKWAFWTVNQWTPGLVRDLVSINKVEKKKDTVCWPLASTDWQTDLCTQYTHAHIQKTEYRVTNFKTAEYTYTELYIY